MKICRFYRQDAAQQFLYGMIKDNRVWTLGERFPSGDVSASLTESYALDQVKLVAPVAPSKIVCVGRNYSEHAKELGNAVPAEPLLFLKAPSSIVTNNEKIFLPPQSAQVEHEGELGIVIKRTAKNIGDNENPLDYVFGYLAVNDVTARDLQRADVQFTRAKSFDTFCPIGDVIETELDPSNLDVAVRVNGVVKQHGSTAQMVFPPAELVRYISRQMTLLPGDLIATGTPAGVSELSSGDTVEVEVEGIGILQNVVSQQ